MSENFGVADDDLVPDAIQGFVEEFHRRVRKRNVYDIQQSYEREFPKLTDKYFKASSWPSAEAVQNLVKNDETTMVLYKDLYFRHIYAKMQPTVDDRFDSFQNYIDLFNLILGLDTEEPELDLPVQWLWDLIDEFIYQFQSFHIYRTRVKQLSPEDVELLKEHQQIWSAQTVVRYLIALVKKAGIDMSRRAGEEKETVSAPSSSEEIHPFFTKLGYFALTGLLRVNCLLCDYQSALQVLDPIDLRKQKGIFTELLACHVTLYYYLGFAYLQLRRYVDSIKIFSYFLSYFQRHRHLVPRTYQADVINKRVEQMQGLLAIAHSLCPEPVDETLLNELREKYGEKLTQMQHGESPVFEEVYSQSCPKFISCCCPKFDEEANIHQEMYHLQLKLFLREVQQRSNLPNIYSYCKLFTSIPTSKLASFLESDEETVSTYLLKLKHKSRNLRWSHGRPAQGTWQTAAPVDFCVEKQMIQITQHHTPRRYGDFFIRQILKCDDIVHQRTTTIQSS